MDRTFRLQCKPFAISCLVLFWPPFYFPLLKPKGEWVALFDSYYRSRALVVGGGHVVLPLEHEVVPAWLDKSS